MKDTALSTFLFHNKCSNDLRHLINDIATATKYIVHAIRTGDLGLAGTSNLYGEDQLALDVLSDRIISQALIESNVVHSIASEEKPEIQQIYNHDNAKYIVVFDPLDGSSLVDTNMAVGSIFGIYKTNNLEGVKGKEMVAAIYTQYGPRTTLTYTIGKGVHEFTLNDVGEYTLTNENLSIKEHTKMFAPGNLRATQHNEGYKKLVDYWMLNGYKLRYSGGMVPDINSIFLKGHGVFSYPGCPKNGPDGKLRLLYECAPFAYIVENAGGMATDGKNRILDIPLESLEHKTPIFIGSKQEVKRAMDFCG